MRLTTSIFLLITFTFFTAIAAILPGTSAIIVTSGTSLYSYGGTDLQLDYATGIFSGFVLGLFLLFGPFNPRLKPTLILLWTIKLIFALWFMLAFEYQYGLDSDGYFMPDWVPESALAFGAGTHNIRLLCWAVLKVIGPSFHGAKVLFAFAAFMGIYLVYRGAVFYLKEESPRLLLILGLSPTVLFWSSLLGKDPIALFCAGLYAHGCMGWIIQARKRYLFEAFLAIVLASFIRPYFIPIMAIPLGIVFVVQGKRPVFRLLMLPLIAFSIYFSLAQFSKRTNVSSLDSFHAYQEKISGGWGGGAGARNKSTYTLPSLPVVLLPLLIPIGVFSALFRPLPFEAHNPFALAAAFDNSILLVLSIYAYRRSRFRDFLAPEILWALSYVLIFSAMYGIGTPNLGALSRFKIQALPHFICLALYLARKRQLVPATQRLTPAHGA